MRLHAAFRDILCSAVCAWAGVPLDEQSHRELTDEMGEMIDNAGTVGPYNWAARVKRWHAERLLRGLVEDVRQDKYEPPAGSALAVIAAHRDGDGEHLPAEIAAVEMLNILRPTLAVARFMTFAGLALHQHPDTRQRLQTDDDYLEAFVQEVRRLSPFFPIVAGVARTAFGWGDLRFEPADRFILDLYGTNRDPRVWDEPRSFRPERFLNWHGDPFAMIPQGGGDHLENHRCPGEWLTIAVMKAILRVLVREIEYAVPEQDLSVDLSVLPTLPKSGFVIKVSRFGPAL